MIAVNLGAQEKPFDGVTLRIFANSHPPMLKAVEWSIPVVKEKFGINLLIDQASYGVQFEKANTDLMSGAGTYDIIVMARQWIGAWADADFIVPVNSFIDADPEFSPDVYVEKAYKVCTLWPEPEGKNYGLPFNMEGRVVFYRKDIFEKEGLFIPTNPKDWLDIVRYFYNNPEYPDFYGAGYMYGTEQGSEYLCETYQMLFDWWNHPGSVNGFWDENHQNVINRDALVQAIRFWQGVRKYMQPGAETFNLPEAYEYFLRGKSAMTEVWPLAMYGLLVEPQNAEFRKKVGTFLPPTGVVTAGGWLMAITSTSKNKEAAWEYLKFMSGEKNDLFFFKKFGKGPSSKATFKDPELVKLYGTDMLTTHQNAVAVSISAGKIAKMSEYYGGEFHTLLTRALLGHLKPEEGADKIIKEMDGILERSGYPQKKR